MLPVGWDEGVNQGGARSAATADPLQVDVWSVGVIFFQMLYGVKPFGDGMTQAHILAEGTIKGATSVSFPVHPKVSNEAKVFIKRCLEYHQAQRPDVLELHADPYLRHSATRKTVAKGGKEAVMEPLM